MITGLKSDEVTTFLDFIVKCNDVQLLKMQEAAFIEIHKRSMRVPDYDENI